MSRRIILNARGTTARLDEIALRLGEMETISGGGSGGGGVTGSSWTYGASVAKISWSTSSGGTSSDLARVDHVHVMPTPQRATPVRTWSTPYTNTGSSPLFVSVVVAIGSAGSDFNLEVNGVNVSEVKAIGVGAAAVFPIFGVVGPGDSYLMTRSATTATVVTWTEYSLG